jgi:hypothetical protein
MIKMNVESNIKAFTRRLDKIHRRQIPFATARALTWTAKEAQAAIQNQIPIIFKVSRKWWLAKQPTGIKIRPATKIEPVAAVYTQAYFADLQERGGTKIPFKGRGLLVPTEQVPKYGRKSGGAKKVMTGKKIIRKGGRSDGDPIVTMPNSVKGIFRRRGKKRLPIERLYTFAESALIHPRMNFRKLAAFVAKKEFDRQFKKSLSMAMKSAV